jgi:pilus assembly protein Flp/PilA
MRHYPARLIPLTEGMQLYSTDIFLVLLLLYLTTVKFVKGESCSFVHRVIVLDSRHQHKGVQKMALGFLRRLLVNEQSGATAIEYGLIAALIAVAAVTVMGTVGTNLSSTFSTVASSL